MTLSTNTIERRLQVSGILLIAGLLIEAVCLLWARPISFLILLAIGGTLLFLGVLMYLLSFLRAKQSPERNPNSQRASR